MQLKDIVEIRSGCSFRERPDRVSHGGVAMVQVRDLDRVKGWVKGDLEQVEPPSNWEGHRLKKGDVLMAARGAHNDAAVFAGEHLAVAASQVLVLRPRQGGQNILPAYLVWFLNRAETQEQLKKMRTGSGIPFLPVEALKTFEVPLPSYEVQQHIVALHQLSVEEDRLVGLIQEKRRELVGAVMKGMMTGQISKPGAGSGEHGAGSRKVTQTMKATRTGVPASVQITKAQLYFRSEDEPKGATEAATRLGTARQVAPGKSGDRSPHSKVDKNLNKKD